MHQAHPAPSPEQPISSLTLRGRQIRSRWPVPASWDALRGGPIESILLALLAACLPLTLLVVGLGTSVAVFGVNWSSLAWQPTPTPSPVPHLVTARVQAFYQGDPAVGWDSPEQYQTWWPSACSPAALTMVLNAWGTQVGIGPVLDHLIALRAISPAQGLLNSDALSQVARAYGYQALTFWRWTKHQVAQMTAQGVPVLVDVVDAYRQTRYSGLYVGHWLVIVGVAADGGVEVKDSSGYRIQALTPTEFQILFMGIGVVVWSGAVALP